ncbi:MAG: hypothetical protein MI784_16615 [Cytophagales bacterium]|nr:hypothetical protein [Cytophagales bacterium]
MKQIQLVPLQGAGKLAFGMSRSDVEKEMGKPFRRFRENEELLPDEPLIDSYFDDQWKIFYDENDQVEYMEFSAFRSEDLKVMFEQIDIFTVPAEGLVSTFESVCGKTCDEELSNQPYSFVFGELELQLWRSVIPEDYEPIEPDDEYGKGEFFTHLGVGRKGFFTEENAD